MQWSEVFAVGSHWFWLLLAVEAAVLIGLIEWGKGLAATLSLVGTLLALQFMGNANLLGLANHHPLLLVFGVVGYFAVGTVWAIARWWLFVHEQRLRYDEARAEFCHDRRLLDGTIPESLQQEWQEHRAGRKRKIEIRPRARKHRGRIIMWMAYWPWSFCWTVLNDPVRKAFKFIFRHIHDYLQEISDNAFRGVDADLPREPDPRAATLPLAVPAPVEKGAVAAGAEEVRV